MGKKKFFDKKKSATFQLYARDTSDPNYADEPGSDRVFVRVDNNPYTIDSLSGENHDDDDSNNADDIFADAPEDIDDDDNDNQDAGREFERPGSKPSLPEHVRKDILELGFPDDGYNYLLHMREIKNTGGGSAYYANPKATFEPLPLDVKAYDASKVQISNVNVNENSVERSIYNVASHTVGVRIQKAIDPEVSALLDDDDDDLSRFGSDVEDLEEDFIVRANFTEEGEGVIVENKLDVVSKASKEELNRSVTSSSHENVADFVGVSEVSNQLLKTGDVSDEKPRVRRLLDDQFDLLESQEYGSDSDDYCGGSVTDEDEALANKLNHAFKDHTVGDLELDEKYRAPADILHTNERSNNTEILDAAADVIRRCVEYGEKYEMEDAEDKNVVIVEESSDESEAWDCETIITTYSNLDNHPGKIGAPGTARRKKLPETVLGQIISLGGKGLPVDFLPDNKKVATEKVKGTDGARTEQQKRKQHGQETKEEKKERKSAVKEERREARRVKKETKGLYRFEAHRAQVVAATSGPSSIHLM